MPSWNELLNEFNAIASNEQKAEWLRTSMNASLNAISNSRDSNVLLYGSAFLQKPGVPPFATQITAEDLNGFMSVIYGMDWERPLTLILHTPGGVTNAAETIVAYLREKFTAIETIIPTFAMSAGTMISLASDRIIMGRQSQLGPIDPQMPIGGRFVSAQAVVEQFGRARSDVLEDQTTAHVWAPILQSLGPALLQEAQNALDYSESMVATWLESYMFSSETNASQKASRCAHHFSDAAAHKSHGRRIDREEAASAGVVVEHLENSQALQESVLSVYHLMTIQFEQSPSVKMLWSNSNRTWIKNWTGQ